MSFKIWELGLKRGTLMRIRHILPEFGRVPRDSWKDSLSGIVRSALTIAIRQAKDIDCNVQFFGLQRDGPRSQYYLENVEVRTTPGWRFGRWNQNDWRYFLPLSLLAVSSHVDILHAHDNPYLLLLPRARKRILHFHTPISGRVTPSFVKASQRADHIVCNSSFIRDDFLSVVSYPQDRISVVHNAVEIDLFRDGARPLRADLGIAHNAGVILFVGQVSWEKGLIHLIRAFSQIEYECELIVAGGNDLWQTINSPTVRDTGQTRLTEYEKEVRAVAKDWSVHFLGTVPTKELRHVYAACDVFVCPSEWPEPFGMVNVEAMAAGKPVIASHTGGIPEIVVDGVTGFLVTPASPSALADALDSLLADEKRRIEMGEAGYQRAKTHFTWDRALAQLRSIYEQVD